MDRGVLQRFDKVYHARAFDLLNKNNRVSALVLFIRNSVLYVAISFASILVHDSLQLARGHKCAMLAIGAVGVGSALFHGTLRYIMMCSLF